MKLKIYSVSYDIKYSSMDYHQLITCTSAKQAKEAIINAVGKRKRSKYK